MNAISSNDPGHPMTIMLHDPVSGKYRAMEISDFDQSRQTDSIMADPRQYQGVPSNFSVGTSDGIILTLGPNEKGFIQNLSTSPLYIKKGDGCSPTSFSFILKAGSAIDDGTGGNATMNDWIGDISICAPANGALRYMAWKMIN